LVIVRQIIEQFRTIQSYWTEDSWLGQRMLFLSGPRQVGKTTLVKSTLCPDKAGYFNWDNRKVRLAWQMDADFFAAADSEWICFDEIHKRPGWKDILKGIFDVHSDRFRFVITGSARLETFKKSGDSLVGRYFQTRLFPLNLPDLTCNDFSLPDNPEELLDSASSLPDAPEFEDLMQLGGFPEPFFKSSETFWKRWSMNHRDLIIQEDLRDLTRIMELDKIEYLLELLEPAVGNTISYSNLARDLETTHGSIKRWLESLNKVQLVFPVSPFSRNIRRSYRQERKWYYMDWRAAGINRFENFVSSSLHRAVSLYTDRFGEKMQLHFIRTHDGTEVDFLITLNNRPWLLIEAREGKPDASRAVYRFCEELDVPCLIVTKQKNVCRKIKHDGRQKIYAVSWAKLGQVLP